MSRKRCSDSGHDVVAIDAGRISSPSLQAAEPMWPSSRCNGRDGEDGAIQELLGAMGIPYTGSGPRRACAPPTRRWPSTSCSAPASPRRRFHASTRPPSANWAPRRRSPPWRPTPASRSSSACQRRVGARGEVRAQQPGAARGGLERSHSDRRAHRELHPGPRLAVSVICGEEDVTALRRAAARRRGCPRGEEFYDYESRLIGMTRSSAPRARAEDDSARTGCSRWRSTICSAAPASPGST